MPHFGRLAYTFCAWDDRSIFPSTSLGTGSMPVGHRAACTRKFANGSSLYPCQGNDESGASSSGGEGSSSESHCVPRHAWPNASQVVHATVVLRYKVGLFSGCTSGCKGKGSCRSMCQSQLNWLRCRESCKLGCDIGSSMSTRFPLQVESSDSLGQNQALNRRLWRALEEWTSSETTKVLIRVLVTGRIYKQTVYGPLGSKTEVTKSEIKKSSYYSNGASRSRRPMSLGSKTGYEVRDQKCQVECCRQRCRG